MTNLAVSWFTASGRYLPCTFATWWSPPSCYRSQCEPTPRCAGGAGDLSLSPSHGNPASRHRSPPQPSLSGWEGCYNELSTGLTLSRFLFRNNNYINRKVTQSLTTKDTSRQQSFCIWFISMNIYEDDNIKNSYNNPNHRWHYFISAQVTHVDKLRHNL